MALSIHTIVRISPVVRADGARPRRRDTAAGDDTVHAQPASTPTELVRHAAADGRHRGPAPKPSVPGTLAAQLIAQKLPGKSDRRLARYFPERVLQAYAQAGRIAPVSRPRHDA
jgi:hypothetical protein